MAEATRGKILLDIGILIHIAETTLSDTAYILALTKLLFKAKELVAFEKAELNRRCIEELAVMLDEDLDSIGRGTFGSKDGSRAENEIPTPQTVGHNRAAAAEAHGILIPANYTVE